jgi:predicted dehydrogenase
LDTGEEEEELAQLTEKDSSNASADPLALDVAGHRRQMEDLVHALQENREPTISGREGLKAMEVILAVYQSAREKRLVELHS